MLTPHVEVEGLALFTSTVARHQHDRHSHAALSVIMLTKGAKSYSVEGRRHAVHAGQIAIANPGEVHGCEYVGTDPWAHRTWYLSEELVSALSEECGFKRRAEIGKPVLDDSRPNKALLIAHRRSIESDDPIDREGAAIVGLTQLLTSFGHAPRDRTPAAATFGDAARRVDRCIEMLSASFHAPLALGLLAQEVGVSRYQVIRDFQRVLRMTPGDYLRSVRLQHAKFLLAKSQPLSAIAAATGFSDQSHLSRAFRRVYGFTPGHYAGLTRQRAWISMI